MDAAAEKEIVRRYFSKAHQDRALYALQSPKRHSYIWNLDESFFRSTGRQELSPGGDIPSELKKQGCGGSCYVISIEETIDGTYAPVEDAIRTTVGNGPALLVFKEAGLSYFEGEYEIGSRTKRFLIRALSRDE